MGLWVNTTYVNHGVVGDVAHALEAIFAAEGMEHVATPPRRVRLLVEPMQYDVALHNDLWGIAAFPGAPGWTVIQTAPLELLAERATGASRMRLADLCARLSASAFQCNVYDSTGTILVEVSRAGEVLLSGFAGQLEAADPLAWHGERLSEDALDTQFRLHPCQDLVADGPSGDELAERVAQRFGGENARFCDNVVSIDTLVSHAPLTATGGAALYFRWTGPTRQRYPAARSWEEHRDRRTPSERDAG